MSGLAECTCCSRCGGSQEVVVDQDSHPAGGFVQITEPCPDCQPKPTQGGVPDGIEAAARAMYEAYFPAEGRESPNDWPQLGVRVRETWQAIALAGRKHFEEDLLSDEGVLQKIGARLLQVSRHGLDSLSPEEHASPREEAKRLLEAALSASREGGR